MRMATPRNILTAGTKLHRYRRLVNQFTRMSPYNVHTKHSVGVLRCENLYEAVRVTTSTRAAVRCKGKPPRTVLHSCCLQCVFRVTG
jgi:hypothetical protein